MQSAERSEDEEAFASMAFLPIVFSNAEMVRVSEVLIIAGISAERISVYHHFISNSFLKDRLPPGI